MPTGDSAMRLPQLRAAFLLLPILAMAGVAAAQNTSDRITALEFDHGYFPCMDCHADQETDFTPRILDEEHAEPLEWEDADGNTHLVPFGRYVSLADLLGESGRDDMNADNMTRIGTRLQITSYMEQNDLAATDSVWTLVHGGGNLWCLNCHDPADRDKLRKINGELLTFNQSQMLCGECHGPKLRDWDLGIHGATIGYWDLTQDTDGTTLRKLCVECHTPHDPAFPSLTPLAGPVARVPGPGARNRVDDHREEAEH